MPLTTEAATLRVWIAACLVTLAGIATEILPRWQPVSSHLLVVAVALMATHVLLGRLPWRAATALPVAALAIDVAIVITYPPPIALAVVVTILGTIAILERPASRSGLERLRWWYAIILRTLATATGSVLLFVSGWDPLDPAFDDPRAVAWLAVAAAMMWAISLLTATRVEALARGEQLWSPLSAGAMDATTLPRLGIWVPVLTIVSGLALGYLITSDAWLAVLALPIAALTVGGRPAQLLASPNTMPDPGTAAAAMAEAQRIARLGSWDWDLVAGTVVWSKEVSRILGFEPRSFLSTTGGHVAWIAANDEERVATVVTRAIADCTSFSIDHDIVRPNGDVRSVHQQGEVIVDEMGMPVRVIGTLHDITDRKALETRLAHRAFHDALTELPNRALFTDRLDRALHAPPDTSGETSPVAVIFLDLDGFKAINDSLGHEAGDIVLIQTAERLRESLRPTDIVARFGGDEFTILLNAVSGPREARRLADRVLTRLRQPTLIGNREALVSASLGIAFGLPGKATAIELLRDADAALYQAKLAGKNRSLVFEPRMNADTIHRTSLQHELQRAVERGELRLHYQPEVDLASGRIVGLEALVRWQHPAHGLIPPGSFLSLAEATGLILPIGNWVMNEACRQAATWIRLHGESAPSSVSVNLSPSQVIDPAFIGRVEASLHDAGLLPHQLVVELGSDWFGHIASHSGRIIAPLRELGARVALDEFGHDPVPLSLLQGGLIDRVKLARPLLRLAADHTRASTVVASLASLSNSLEVTVAAEGLETGEQITHARDLGATLGQGYVFSPPVPSDAIGNLLAQDHVYDVVPSIVPVRPAIITRLRGNG